MKVSALNVHPVKSTAIRPVGQARVEPWGLAGDRRWMVVDAEGVLVTARTDHRLFTVTAETPQTAAVSHDLVLDAPGMDRLSLSHPRGRRVPVRLHRVDLHAIPAGADADAWLRQALGRDDVRLVWCDDPTRRHPNPEFSRAGDTLSFQDGYPLLLTTTASLRQLNDWIAEGASERGEPAPEPLAMQRFRPNVVVEAVDEAFAEDSWDRVHIGPVQLRRAKDCDRCVMTTIDPDDLSTGKEPIRTLARHRRRDGRTWFGRQLIPEATGVIRVGDQVTVLV